MADWAGIKQSTFNRWLTDKRKKPNAMPCMQLAGAFNESPNRVLVIAGYRPNEIEVLLRQFPHDTDEPTLYDELPRVAETPAPYKESDGAGCESG